MFKSRIIPSLLISDNGLVKTTKFQDQRYIGDPLNTVKIFNEKFADEIIITDIDCSIQNKEPNFNLIETISEQSRMPVCYVGGIKNEVQAKKIISLGIEKIGISSLVFENLNEVKKISNSIGSQSLVVILDLKFDILKINYNIYIHNGNVNTKISIDSFITNYIPKIEFGELILNSIDFDGEMKGYNIPLIEKVYKNINMPLTVLGGAGKIENIKEIFEKYKFVSCAAGSLFIYKGKFKAVLINYPDLKTRLKI